MTDHTFGVVVDREVVDVHQTGVVKIWCGCRENFQTLIIFTHRSSK